MNRIKELREQKGFTSIREFTHFINDELHYDVSVATMVLLEKDKRLNRDFTVINGTVIELKGVNPPYRLVKVLADYFGVSIEYMMNE